MSTKLSPSEVAWQEQEAARLKAKGLSAEAIAEELGIGRSTAYRRIQGGLAALPVRSLQEYRAQQELRLEHAIRVAASIMMDEQEHGPELRLKALDRLLKVEERLAKLLGLDEPRGITEELVRAELGMEY